MPEAAGANATASISWTNNNGLDLEFLIELQFAATENGEYTLKGFTKVVGKDFTTHTNQFASWFTQTGWYRVAVRAYWYDNMAFSVSDPVLVSP